MRTQRVDLRTECCRALQLAEGCNVLFPLFFPTCRGGGVAAHGPVPPDVRGRGAADGAGGAGGGALPRVAPARAAPLQPLPQPPLLLPALDGAVGVHHGASATLRPAGTCCVSMAGLEGFACEVGDGDIRFYGLSKYRVRHRTLSVRWV